MYPAHLAKFEKLIYLKTKSCYQSLQLLPSVMMLDCSNYFFIGTPTAA